MKKLAAIAFAAFLCSGDAVAGLPVDVPSTSITDFGTGTLELQVVSGNVFAFTAAACPASLGTNSYVQLSVSANPTVFATSQHVCGISPGGPDALVLVSTPGGGAGSPGGSNGQIQYNNNGVFGGFSVSGDAVIDGSGNLVFSTVNSTPGAFGSPSACPSFTVNGKGLVTAASAAACTPAIGNVTGLGTGVSAALNVAPGTAGSFVINGGALGTPSSGIGTNLTGSAAGFTAGNVTTNANLTGPITSSGNTTSIASQTGTGSKFVVDTSPTLVTPNIGTPSAGVATNLTGTAAGLTAGHVTTNANLTGDVTSSGNAATLANAGPGATGPIGSTTTTPVITIDAKGRVTALGSATIAGGSATPGGTNGQVQFNSAGAFGGFTVSGDGTLNTSTGALGVTKTGGTAFGPAATAAQGQIPGVAGNTAASAGNVGEYITSSVVPGSAVTLTTGVAANVTSVSLTAGDWQCTGNVGVAPSGTITLAQGWTSTVSATQPAAPPNNGGYTTSGTLASTNGILLNAGSQQFLFSGTTTVFLGVFANFTGTAGGYGFIGCRRMR